MQQIKTPALLLVGEKEVIFSAPKAIDCATRLISNIQAEMIPDAGHIPSMDQPEMVNERILNFLSKKLMLEKVMGIKTIIIRTEKKAHNLEELKNVIQYILIIDSINSILGTIGG